MTSAAVSWSAHPPRESQQQSRPSAPLSLNHNHRGRVAPHTPAPPYPRHCSAQQGMQSRVRICSATGAFALRLQRLPLRAHGSPPNADPAPPDSARGCSAQVVLEVTCRVRGGCVPRRSHPRRFRSVRHASVRDAAKGDDGGAVASTSSVSAIPWLPDGPSGLTYHFEVAVRRLSDQWKATCPLPGRHVKKAGCSTGANGTTSHWPP
jgi:hypothetical protein